MKRILWSAYYEFLKNIRDVRILVFLIVFPISVILILGTALDNALTEDIKNKIKVGYVVEDKGQIGESIEKLFENSEIRKLIDKTRYENESEAIKAVEKGQIDNYFIVPEATTDNFRNKKAAVIRLDGKKNIELVQTILNSFISESNAYSLAVDMTKGTINIKEQKQSAEYFERIMPVNTKLPEAIDYYSVLTLLQVISMGALLGIFIVSRSHETNIHIRLHSLPTSKWTLICGKVLGSSLVLFLSCIITVVFTKFVYHANWDGNLLIIALVLMVFSFLCIGIGIMIHSFVSSFVSALGITFLVTLLTASAGGAISPATSIQSLNLVNPVYYAKVLIFGALYNYPNSVMYKSAIGLLAILAVLYTLAFIKLRRVNYDNI